MQKIKFYIFKNDAQHVHELRKCGAFLIAYILLYGKHNLRKPNELVDSNCSNTKETYINIFQNARKCIYNAATMYNCKYTAGSCLASFYVWFLVKDSFCFVTN